MELLVALVFVGAFTLVALLFAAGNATGTRKNKQVTAIIDSAVKPEERKKTRAPIINFRKNELFSAIPWINRRLVKFNLAPRLHNLLNQADLQWTAGTLLLMCAIGYALPAYLVYLKTGSWIFALVVGLPLSFAPLGFVLIKRGQRFGKFEQGLPDALELMVGALRVGHSLSAALGLVTRECADPIGCEFRTCFEEQNYGLELRVSFENMLFRVPLQDLRIVVTAILIQKECGGNLAEVLEKTAYVIRQRFRLKRQVQVHTAQGRLTGWILTLLPIVLGIGLYIVNPTTMSLLWTRDLGIKLLCTAGAMLVTGTLIIQKIVRMDV